MKKHLIAAAALATLSTAAFAQNVTVYGILDTSIVVDNNHGTSGQKRTSMESGNWLPSLWGMTGSEDLGGGLKANFKLEANLNTDNGQSGAGIAGGTASELFDRQAWVSVSSKDAGELRLGKQIDALFLQSFLNNVRLSHANSAAVMGGLAAGGTWSGTVFSPNTITYVTPALNGFKLTAQHQLGETAGNNSASSATALLVNYDGVKDLSLSFGRKEGKNSSGAKDQETTLVGAVYKLGNVQLNAQSNNYKWTATGATRGDELRLVEFGIGYAVTPQLTAAINYVDWENNDASASTKYSTDITSVSLKYSLSKRTSIYTMASRVDKVENGSGATGAVPASPAYLSGTSTLTTKARSGYSVGITHTF